MLPVKHTEHFFPKTKTVTVSQIHLGSKQAIKLGNRTRNAGVTKKYAQPIHIPSPHLVASLSLPFHSFIRTCLFLSLGFLFSPFPLFIVPISFPCLSFPFHFKHLNVSNKKRKAGQEYKKRGLANTLAADRCLVTLATTSYGTAQINTIPAPARKKFPALASGWGAKRCFLVKR